MTEPSEPAANPEPEKTIDPVALRMAMDRIRSEQRLALSILGGGAAALAGAAAWAAITVFTKYQIGWMAVGVGLLVGFTVRHLGRGVTPVFGLVGGAWALIGCGVGNLLAVCGLVSQEQHVPLFQILRGLDIELASGLMAASFNPMDLLFYGIAVFEGFKFSRRSITGEELERYLTGAPVP
jgi:hypothetical protein